MDNWLIRTTIITVVAAILGTFLLDLISVTWGLLGRDPFDVAPSARIALAVSLVSFSIVVEHSYSVQKQLQQHREALEHRLVNRVESEIGTRFGSTLNALGLMAGSAESLSSQALTSTMNDVASLVAPIAALQEPLRSGTATWMAEPMRNQRGELQRLLSNGVEVSLARHVAVTEAMVNASVQSYLQVNLRPLRPETEWTNRWKDFVAAAGAADGVSLEYLLIVREPGDFGIQDRVRATISFLSQHNWTVRVAIQHDIEELLGTSWDLSTNVEVFDRRFAKIQSVSPDGYRGGNFVQMRLGPIDAFPQEAISIDAALRAARKGLS